MLAALTFLVLLASSSSRTTVHGQLLHPLDLVIGKWNVDLCRRDRSLLESMVFPPNMSSKEASYEDISNDNDVKSTSRQQRRRRRQHQRNLQCELILEEDGTFTLNPPSDLCQNSLEGENLQINRQPLKGSWNLRPNPYCVTDRQYDELTLVSNPKVRCGVGRVTNKEEERVVMEMQCKVWGRFGSNTIRTLLNYSRGRDAGRFTHGTLSIRKDLIDKELDTDSTLSTGISCRRAVCATFKARACSKR
mmetsp:Transcript_7760/g.11781  ORF Transcript_7760/g.11781 Transcript_7760/m.11781 type:complete len:248 (+) Transcript_7760:145-888(+)